MSAFGQKSFYKILDGKLGFENDAAGQWNYLVEKGKTHSSQLILQHRVYVK